MRVLHVHERAGFHGGVEQILLDTARGLAGLGWPQGLLHHDPAPENDFVTAFERSSDREAILRDFAPDVLFLHKVERADTVRELAGRFPAVRMVHDHDLVCPRRHKYFPISTRICDHPAGLACYLHLCVIQRGGGGPLPFRLARVGERRRAIQAHQAVRRLLVGSEWMRRELAMNGIGQERIDIVPPIPAALEEVRALPPSNEPEVLFVGQVIRGKGVDLLLRALARVPEPWHATVVGTGNHLGACRGLARELGVAGRVRFAGWVPHDRLGPLYERAAITVVPSRWPEPFGMVGVEAMARGRPVVGFAVGGIPDWLEHEVTGLLAPEADTTALADAIHRLLRDEPLRRRLGTAAVERVRRDYRPGAYLRRVMDILGAVT
jgi:glycosyltransferase involved in cell wall biosynthesis